MNLKLENSWQELLAAEMQKPYFKQLIEFIEQEYLNKQAKIFPPENQVFRAFNDCPIDKVKVVILGQDPYPTKGYAHGLCFSVEENVRPFPKSLNNIFKELESDLKIPFPENGSLVRWAKQGVLLLNTVLTVEEGKPESHAKIGWEKFTDATITLLNQHSDGIVYLLWGAKAQEKAALVDPMKNCILKSAHPSPLSAYRGFLGCKHFSQTNSYLVNQGKEKISW
jgi:uracil-DNA glycosylase